MAIKFFNVRGALAGKELSGDGSSLWVYTDVSNSILDGIELKKGSIVKEIKVPWGIKYLDEGIPGVKRHRDKYFLGWRYDLSKFVDGSVPHDKIVSDVKHLLNQIDDFTE